MNELIARVFEKKMNDGTIEKIVSDKIDEMVKQICHDQMNWNGAAKKAMEEKLNPLILQAVERCDLSSMVTKITMLLNTSLQGSEVESYHSALDAVRTAFGANDALRKLKEKKVVKLSEIFKEYKKYLQHIYDRDDFDSADIYDDGESCTASIECSLRVASEEDRGFSWRKPGYEVELSTDKSDDKKSGDIRFGLKWDYDGTHLRLSGDFRSLTLSDLCHAPEFILYLAAIEREWLAVEIDVYDEDDEVEIDCS